MADSIRAPSEVAPTRWQVERAVLRSDLPPLARHLMLTLLTYTDSGGVQVSQRYGPSLTALAGATGLGRSTVARELNRLEEGGWMLRARPEVEDARANGARTGYTLCPGPGSPTAGLGGPGAGLPVVPERDGGSPGAGHSPEASRTSQQQAAARIVIDKTGATEAEADAMVDLIEAEKHPDKIAGFVSKLAHDGELPQWLARVRAARAAADKQAMGRIAHDYEGRPHGHCLACERHETNSIHRRKGES